MTMFRLRNPSCRGNQMYPVMRRRAIKRLCILRAMFRPGAGKRAMYSDVAIVSTSCSTAVSFMASCSSFPTPTMCLSILSRVLIAGPGLSSCEVLVDVVEYVKDRKNRPG